MAERTTIKRMPFDGEPPDVEDGDRIEYRDIGGVWRQSVARSEPRYDRANAYDGRCYLTVRVRHARWPGGVNWPAEDVRPIGGDLP